MYFWDTGDRVIDKILVGMEALSRWDCDTGPNELRYRLAKLSNIEKMLPHSISKHFDLPYLYAGNLQMAEYEEYNQDLVRCINEALKVGLEKVKHDQNTNNPGTGEFADRPKSRGEVIIEAIDRFDRRNTQESLLALKRAVTPNRLKNRMKTIEMLYMRKQPYGKMHPKEAMNIELSRLKFEAEIYFVQPA